MYISLLTELLIFIVSNFAHFPMKFTENMYALCSYLGLFLLETKLMLAHFFPLPFYICV